MLIGCLAKGAPPLDSKNPGPASRPFPALRRTPLRERRAAEVRGGSGVFRWRNAERDEVASRPAVAAGEGEGPEVPRGGGARLLELVTRTAGALDGRMGLLHARSVEI